MNPKFSIITVCYNSEKTIIDTIESVLSQTYTDLEYIIIDGKSTDKTIEIIKSYKHKFIEKEIPFYWISEPDNGIYDAMNKGIAKAKGELIGIINSDDWYEKNALNAIVDICNKNDNLSIYSGEMNRVNASKRAYKVNYNKKLVKKYINKKMPINHPATFVHKNVYNEIGCFDTSYQLSADYDFVFRAYKAKTRFNFTDKIIVNMRNTGITGSLKSLWITANEDNNIRRKNNVKLYRYYYAKRVAFNCLIILRNTLRNFMTT